MNAHPPAAPALAMRGISKSFGATRALDEVDFELEAGRVHALLGENGAGKSTLMKILSGAIKPDAGRIILDGEPYAPAGPLDGRRRGISMIYQELNLAPHLTVEENIVLGREPRSFGFVDRTAMRNRVRSALELVHHPEISPGVRVKGLSVGAKQLVEITRALFEKTRILIMDEPTSSLSLEDTERLFEIIGRLKAEGVGIIYISHFLEEVQRVADTVTVLRDGRRVHTGDMSRVTLDDLIRMMVGKEVKEMFPRLPHAVGEVVVSARKFRGKRMPSAVDLELHRGEILGLAGLIGSGRTEALRTLFGLDELDSGVVEVFGRASGRLAPNRMIRRGLGFLSEDRQGEGLALPQSLADNLTLSFFGPYVRLGFLRVKLQIRAAEDWIRRMNIKARHARQPVSSLSGGNQQKVALARLLHQKADILLLDEPTRGIDVVSKSQIYEWIGRLAQEGKAVLFVSSYFPELLGVCDRIAAFHRGQIVDVKPAEDWDEHRLMTAATMGRAA
ncbi:MAG: sugar ABC transporter ATP-binding protein [Candidatus Aminicenantes bacterium]|nr:sugar ABC transporter ATP-binding protein [Candidatus Aminicenantes bacterium]